MHHILWAMAEGADLNRMKDHIITFYLHVMIVSGHWTSDAEEL